MKLLKLSPSKIETWRKYQDEEYNGFITKEKVIESITNKGEWSQAATFGSAFHLVMEHGAERFFNPEDGLYHIYDDEMPHEVVLTYKEIYLADDFHKKHPNAVWEISGTLYLDVDEYRVMINYRIDMMEGMQIHENKTSKSDLQYDFFEASYQYRVYLVATGAPVVQYNVFSYDEPNTKRKEYEVYYDHMTLFPYDGMVEDLKQGIRGLINFCQVMDLMDNLLVKPKPKIKHTSTLSL